MLAYLYCSRCHACAVAATPGEQVPGHCPKCGWSDEVHHLQRRNWMRVLSRVLSVHSKKGARK